MSEAEKPRGDARAVSGEETRQNIVQSPPKRHLVGDLFACKVLRVGIELLFVGGFGLSKPLQGWHPVEVYSV